MGATPKLADGQVSERRRPAAAPWMDAAAESLTNPLSAPTDPRAEGSHDRGTGSGTAREVALR
jgi:hypothetical protein